MIYNQLIVTPTVIIKIFSVEDQYHLDPELLLIVDHN